ncbi:NAD(P)(+)--arginine ADP-ribosyltransferase 2-like isoform X2 [Thalassophryne amazonica]|nr:NAD(P)(+)--arginine ADP-ribosyltransferase 2-like isoform X2 [Thalassophryne amazonica]
MVVFEEALNITQCFNDAKQKAKEPAHMFLKKSHSTAIYTYTNAMMVATNQHKTAAKATEQSEDKDPSQCHVPYSSLSEAIQILRHSQVICVNTYYRSDVVLHYNISNKHFRFSTFILGSTEWNLSRNASCFEVHTCFGADITYYSALILTDQVLIPPYEVFKVTDTQTDRQRCKVIYRLRSILNCVYDKDSNMLLPISALLLDEFWLTFIIICIIIVSLLLIFVIVKVVRIHDKKRAVCRVIPRDQSTYSPAEAVL